MSLEIERSYLLDRLPDIPHGAEVLRIEQGYLPDDDASTDDSASAEGEITEGRLRRTQYPDGRVICHWTIKRGEGLVREEEERDISEEEFRRAWPRVGGRCLRKTRYRVDVGSHTWEIDAFENLALVLAEVELTGVDDTPDVPDWLRTHLVRDVTDEKDYRNYELALRLARERVS